ncbi:bifunctional [glutamate--ammonia ligase]-adenylyl-L-tyrosine phosphorylase/[glutamate--ammonia-ligase] adenylyltransferase [Sinimarinibacterium sp. CAU 1509]|uniref:bifunctional [glutamate--ammonia ligase]-adenylyl-L-tyrosine phosphorylase/[glutamate--ammonia-ligase] adenylyltransferase n=1 Tax=Sinimarinibacterium sp. CAU 1509 TaxID=2562283 RepID=UPI0010ACD9D1|nr:bifunctional [glutamate--ammonia ligase]-adenylyl-L-tyrosine phosphorylase/[glutamate--ammonia-ligase] adenylyltransferase [Sinimarinibacterium sp. CAU 1509]TJY59334.1 bifunctional [glutamate--ammonia ligase]-adenylyl-L-tyrosine phosphorylase/[glutamate--ammonia-ligase] adenylyltransferase [Sinimarinibacterium sp. CAU 1509]
MDEILERVKQCCPELAQPLERPLRASRFLRTALGGMLQQGDDCADFLRSVAAAEIVHAVDAALSADDSNEAQQCALRQLRRRYMARIAFRDIAGLAPLDETLVDLSNLADACVDSALRAVAGRLQQRYGIPRDAEGTVVTPVVLGMGKLGGRELNFSSDIDLIFCHTDGGQTDGERPISCDEYFAKLAQETTRLLVAQTVDGFVFRVDTMLRPFGSVGALSASFPALEDYYQEHGREWERYALIKARPIAGDLEAGEQLLSLLRPFVYRRYLDYNAISNLRDLKRMIEDDVQRKGLHDNVKLGSGGIREIEFIVQSFQLVRGGAESELRDNRLRPTLRYLGQSGHLAAEVAERLDQAYVFLRRLENAIQMYDDRQTHAIPTDADAQAALVAALDLPDWSTLIQQWKETQQFVREQFDHVFADAAAQPPDPHQGLIDALWNQALPEPQAAEMLRASGFVADPEQVARHIEALRHVRLVRAMREEAVAKLRTLLARLLSEALSLRHPEQALGRVLQVVEAVAGRSTYLTLLRESSGARKQLVRLCAASPWLSEFIARSPIVLDTLLDPRSLYEPPAREEIVSDLARRCDDLDVPEDTERAMELLRQFQKEMTLRIAAADLVEALPLVQVSDRLTWLAEAIVERALHFAWAEMRQQYGEPLRSDGTVAGLSVIAYGKFGGIELGYGSDLDLVFLHDCDQLGADSVGGARSIDNGTYMTRLAQRLINWLSTQTPAGRAYEVDMELRPNGRSGLLVSSESSFADYQRNEAWTWEHQALTRSRFICGSKTIGERFAKLRHEVITRERDPETLRQQIVDMRAKMRLNLDKTSAEGWDIKQGVGGLIDIEFITQFLVLRDAHRSPQIAQWSDNWRQLDALAEAGSIEPDDAKQLIHCYRRYRVWAHARSLQSTSGLTPVDAFAEERAVIDTLRRKLLGA